MITKRVSVYSILAIFCCSGKIFGMAPYEIGRDARKRLECRKSKSQIINYLSITITSGIMIYCFVLLEIKQKDGERTKERTLLAIVNSWKILCAILTILGFVIKLQHFVKAYEKLNECDENAKWMTKNSYVPYFLTSVCWMCVCHLEAIVYRLPDFYTETVTAETMLLDCFSSGLQGLIHNYVMVYYVVYVFMIFRRFVLIDRFVVLLTELPANEIDTRYPLQLFKTVSNMYENLCSGTDHINAVFSFPLFGILMFNFTEILLLIYIFYGEGETTFYEKYLLTSNVTKLFVLMLPTALVVHKVNSMVSKLSEAESCYEREELSRARNTIFLQTLHYSVEFNACGFFPITISALVGQLSVCVSLLLLMFQLTSTGGHQISKLTN